MLGTKFFANQSLAIDLGNTNTVVTDKKNTLLSEPSCIVLNRYTQSVKAVGGKAFEMFEKTHESLEAVKPLRGGVIADYNSAEKMLNALVRKIYPGNSLFSNFDHVIAGVPFYTTEVEKRALRDALGQFRSSHTHLLYEPLAAAIGMGFDITEPDGKLIVDIGGGITEIVIISLSGIVTFDSIRVAGDTFDEEIQDYFRRNYSMGIGIRTAELVKMHVGSVMPYLNNAPKPFQVIGKDLINGIPMKRSIGYQEVASILDKSFSKIEQSIVQTLESCLPELSSDIFTNGIVVTGGSSLLRGIKERLESRVHLPVHLDSYALQSVSKGITKVLHAPQKFRHVLL
jgi:rod shape-determining protein MreB